jgi:hypothetical protein
VTAVHVTQRRGDGWSLAGLAAALAGVGASVVLIVRTQDDLGGIVWPLVVAPLLLALLSVARPARGVRIAAALAMGAWCIVTGFSIGLLLVPSFVLMAVAAARTET